MQYSPTWANRLSGRGDTWLTADRRSGRRPSAKWVLRFSILLGVFCISTAILAVEGQAALQENDLQGARQHISSRRLLSANDTSNVPVYERCDFETDNYPYAFVVLYAVCVLIFFIALAIICDDFFVPSLEVISEKLDLSEDVAGATFMAAGSSAPELFTSIAGVSVDSDVGVGTIVGSAVFNINIIIALTAALAGQVLNLDYRPLIRDSIFYALSIACFIGFSWDGKFKIEEAIIMLLLYGFYIGIMKFNSSIMNSRCCKSRVGPVPLDEEGSIEGENEDTHMKRSSSTLESFSNVGPSGKLPSIQDDAHPQKEESLSVTGDHKHVFHHVKHGELSSHFLENDHHHLHHSHANEHGVWYLFVVKGHPTKSTETHSQADLRRDLDNSETGSRPRSCGRRSRPLSAASSRGNNNNNMANGHANIIAVSNGDVPCIEYSSHSDHILGTVQTNGDVHKNNSIKTSRDVELGELDSLGGDSNYGSQTHLQLPNNNSDLDSGIHSALGPTPVQPVYHCSSDPSNSSDSKKRHSVAGDDHVAESAANGNIKEDLTEEEDEPTLRPIPCLPAINMYYPEKDILQEKCGCFRLILKWFLFLVSFPFVCLFTWTIPNCGNPKYRKWYIASFTISVIWIAALSFAMVTLVIRAGCILHVDHYTMGLVIVAIGTSVPDALSSILVARDGYGDMAVSNALGSNVFDINLGLGLPYVIKIAIMGGKPFQLISDAEMVMLNSGDMVITPHAKFGFILLLILVLTLIIFAAVRFRLNKVVGVSFVAMYVLFLIYAFVQELVCDYNC